MALDTGDQQKTFNWEDPLDLASRLTEEERMVWESARAYAREKLLPRVVSAYADERFDREIMSEMGALGFLGATLPEQYGGAGASLTPSPTIATRPSCSRMVLMNSTLSSGMRPPRASVKPSCEAIASATPWLSPDNITSRFRPIPRSCAITSAAPSRGVSWRARTPR